MKKTAYVKYFSLNTSFENVPAYYSYCYMNERKLAMSTAVMLRILYCVIYNNNTISVRRTYIYKPMSISNRILYGRKQNYLVHSAVVIVKSKTLRETLYTTA